MLYLNSGYEIHIESAKNILAPKQLFTSVMYSIEEKCETAKTPGGQTHVQLHEKKTVTSLKFKTIFAPEIQLYLHRNDNS